MAASSGISGGMQEGLFWRKYLSTSLLIMSCVNGDGGTGSVDATRIEGSSISGREAEGARDDGGVGSIADSVAFLFFLDRAFFAASASGASIRGSWGVEAAMGRADDVGGVMGMGTKGVLGRTDGAAGAEMVDVSTLAGARGVWAG